MNRVDVDLNPTKSQLSWFWAAVLLWALGTTVHEWWVSREALHLVAMIAAFIAVGSFRYALLLSKRKQLTGLRYERETQTLSFLENNEEASSFSLRGTPYRVEVDDAPDTGFGGLLVAVGLLDSHPSTHAIVRLRNQRYTLELPTCSSEVDARVLAQAVNSRARDGELNDGEFDVERSETESTIRWTLEVTREARLAALLMFISLVGVAFWILPGFEENPVVGVVAMLPVLFFVSLFARAPLRRSQKRFVTLSRVDEGLRLCTKDFDVVTEKPEIDLSMFRGDALLVVGKPKDAKGRRKRTGLVTLQVGSTIHLAELLYAERERLRMSSP